MELDITPKQCRAVVKFIRNTMVSSRPTLNPDQEFEWITDMVLAVRALEEACAARQPVTHTVPAPAHPSDEAPGARALGDTPPVETAAAPRPEAVSGAREAALLKKDTHARLRAFRETRGLGCFGALAKAAGNGIDDITLSRMHSGERFSIDLWRSVAKALDKLEQKEEENNG